MRVASGDQHEESKITWSRASRIDDFLLRPNEGDANFYMLLGSVDGRCYLFYLGKVFDQYVSWRIVQPDHQDRVREICRRYPDTDVLISVGVISTVDRNRYDRDFIDNIESLLILTHQPEFNDKKRSWPHIRWWHYVINQSHFEPLHRIVYVGPAVGS